MNGLETPSDGKNANSNRTSTNVERKGGGASGSGLVHSGPLRTVLTPTSGAILHGGITPATHRFKQHDATSKLNVERPLKSDPLQTPPQILLEKSEAMKEQHASTVSNSTPPQVVYNPATTASSATEFFATPVLLPQRDVAAPLLDRQQPNLYTSNKGIPSAPISAPFMVHPLQQKQPTPDTVPVSTKGTAPTTLDQEIDDFLCSNRNSNLPALLFPEPFPLVDSDDSNLDAILFQQVIYFANHRQWNNLIDATNAIFLLGKGEHDEIEDHGTFFQNILCRDDISQKATAPLTAKQQQLQQEMCIMLHFRFVALTKVRKYSQLGHETERLCLIPTASRNDTPSWVPIGLQISAIQTLQYTDNPQRCIDTLHQLFYFLSSTADTVNESPAKRKIHQCWNMRIQSTLSNVFVRLKEWRMAIISLEFVLSHLIDGVHMEVASNTQLSSYNDGGVEKLILAASRIEVLSRQGRILVQAGAMSEAEQIFQRIEEEDYVTFCSLKQKMHDLLYQQLFNNMWIVQKVSTNILINKGLTLFAREQYDQAMEQYKLAADEEAIISNRETANGSSTIFSHTVLYPGIGLDPPEEHTSYLPHCWNNMALCSLYSCRMHEAVVMLESLIRENPTMYLTETLTFNLCTLYELGSDNTVSGKKKRMLQLIAKRFSIQDIGAESFRITT